MTTTKYPHCLHITGGTITCCFCGHIFATRFPEVALIADHGRYHPDGIVPYVNIHHETCPTREQFGNMSEFCS